MEPGENIAECCIREVHEETGLSIQLGRLLGVYSDPHHVVAYDDGEIRQEFSICFTGRIDGGAIATSSESSEVAFVSLADLADLRMHPSIRQRIADFSAQNAGVFIR